VLSVRNRRRVAGLVVGLSLGLGVASELAARYFTSKYTEVEVTFEQTGLQSAGLIKIEVDCVPVYVSSKPPHAERLRLGWLDRSDLITVQARVGSEGGALSASVHTDGASRLIYENPGGRFNPGGVGAKRKPGSWLAYRTVTATGVHVASAGCGAAVPQQLSRQLPAMRRGSARLPGTLISATTTIAPLFLSTLTAMGLMLLLLAATQQARATWRESKEANVFAVIAAIGAFVFAAADIAKLLEVPVVEEIPMIIGALAWTFAALFLLGPELRAAAIWIERTASALFAARMPPEPPKSEAPRRGPDVPKSGGAAPGKLVREAGIVVPAGRMRTKVAAPPTSEPTEPRRSPKAPGKGG
jgi:hypothetical protein